MMAPFLSSQASIKISSTIPDQQFAISGSASTMPTYGLTSDVKVVKVNTAAPDDVDEIEVHIRYQVTDPSQTLRGIPNRGQIQSDVAKEMGVSVVRPALMWPSGKNSYRGRCRLGR